MKTAIALASIAWVSALGAGAANPQVVAFNATVRVEVDAAGKPVKVDAPADLPDSVRAYIEKRVRSWQYAPARMNGAPAPAVTYVRVGACALPVESGYRLGLDFKGNGPGIVDKGPWFIPPPRYPQELMRVGAEGEFKVSYSIQPDGRTKVTSIEPIEGMSNRHAKVFRSALAAWIDGLRYEPEQVGGVAVATEMTFPVSFALRTPPSSKAYREELETQALASKECLAATMPGGPLPIATNSPVVVTPAPAG